MKIMYAVRVGKEIFIVYSGEARFAIDVVMDIWPKEQNVYLCQ